MRRKVKEYLRQGKARGWSEKTVAVYRHRLNLLGRYLRWPKVAEVTPRELERFLESLRKSGWKQAGRRSMASTIRNLFRWLAGEGRLLSNPARNLSVEREGQVELPPPPLSIEEVMDLLDHLPRRNALDLRDRALLELLYGCGLRLSEAIALDLKDVDLPNRVLHVRRGKGGKSRDLPLGRSAARAVKDWLAARRSLVKRHDHGALLLDPKGRRIRVFHVEMLFGGLNKQRGPGARHLHPHLLRHSVASHLLQNGADIRYVQEFLGHEKLDTTKIYLRLVPDQLKEEYEKAMPEILVRRVGATSKRVDK